MIDKPTHATVEHAGREWKLELKPVEWGADEKPTRWEVTTESGAEIGTVQKDSYTYSPKAAGFGGRIVRYHKKVACWKCSPGPKSDRESDRTPRRTRKEALEQLMRALWRRGAAEEAVKDFADEHGDAEFRVKRDGEWAAGRALRLHQGGLVVRAEGGDAKVRLREVLSDTAPALEVRLPGSEWEPVANAVPALARVY